MDDTWVNSIKDQEMQKVLLMARNIAPRKATILIYGESGVGKELLSRYIHNHSHRENGQFVAVNCAALPENLLESELFGYEKGAFTGAQSTKEGKIERAHRGTFLLDEISEMPLLLQGKLLRVLQEGEVERLGGTRTRSIDVRFICTSNRNLSEMVAEKKFRKDLYYRLNVVPLKIPPLRERKKDIRPLVNFLVSEISRENEISNISVSEGAMSKILKAKWSGNIRELRNVLERSILLNPGSTIEGDQLLVDLQTENSVPQESGLKAGMTIQEAEKKLILKTLESTEQNRTHAAKILGISIRTLRNKLNEYKSIASAEV